MILKGKTSIELTDVNTGEVEIKEEENMLTNALSYLYNYNPMGVFSSFTNTSFIVDFNSEFIPVCPNILGGIFLFSEPLEEDAEFIFPESGQLPMAYASNEVNPYEDAKRGSMNLNESMAITNGYKLVWEFSTSQGNGTIATLALTNKYGGASVYGNEYDDGTVIVPIKRDSITGLEIWERRMFLFTVEVDTENEILYSIYYESTGIYIYKARIPIHSIALGENLDGVHYELLEEVVITPSSFAFSSYSYYYYGEFCDGEDGYWYGLTHTGNSNGSASVDWIKISKEDYSFTEGTWTFSGVYLSKAGTYDTKYYYRTMKNCIRNGYWYAISYNLSNVYKINLNNITDVTLISLGKTIEENGMGDSAYTYILMTVIQGIIMGLDFMILEDDTVVLTKGDTKFTYMGTRAYQWKQYLFTWTMNSRSVFLLTPYLATINNLSSAVVKTADKTMKITYTLTEED